MMKVKTFLISCVQFFTAFGDIVSLKILLKLVSNRGPCLKAARLLFTVPAIATSLLGIGDEFVCIRYLLN